MKNTDQDSEWADVFRHLRKGSKLKPRDALPMLFGFKDGPIVNPPWIPISGGFTGDAGRRLLPAAGTTEAQALDKRRQDFGSAVREWQLCEDTDLRRSLASYVAWVESANKEKEPADRWVIPWLDAAGDAGLLGARKGSTKAEQNCKRWLVDLMKESRDKPATKESLEACASRREDCEGISDRGFERAWSDAIDEACAPAWRKPGRRPSAKN